MNATKQDINRLVTPDTGGKVLGGALVPASMPARTGFEPAAKKGSGVSSPITEESRELHTVQAVSSDGLFVWTVPKQISMQDADGLSLVFVYKEPV